MTIAVDNKTFKHDETFDGRPVTKGFDLSGGRIKVATVSAKDLRLINQYALKTMEAGDVVTYETQLANNIVDRDGERFSEEILQDFADTIPGKSLLMAHQWGPPGIGRFYKGELKMVPGENGASVMWLVASFYLLRDGNETLIKNIDAGIVWAMSIGFLSPDRVLIRKENGDPLFVEYRRGPNGEQGEAIEGSMVFLGSQFDAAIAKDVQKQVAQRSLEAYNAKHCPTCHQGTKPHDTGTGVPPNAEGDCPVGYEMRGDMCYKKDVTIIVDPAEILTLLPPEETKRQSILTAIAQWLGLGAMVTPPAVEKDPGKEAVDTAGKIGDTGQVEVKPGVEPKGDEPMTIEERNALKAEIVAEFKALLAPFTESIDGLRASITEMKTTMADVQAKQLALAGEYKGEMQDVNDGIEKTLARLEAVEAIFAAPKGTGADGADGGDKKEVWAGSLMPKEFRRK